MDIISICLLVPSKAEFRLTDNNDNKCNNHTSSHLNTGDLLFMYGLTQDHYQHIYRSRVNDKRRKNEKRIIVTWVLASNTNTYTITTMVSNKNSKNSIHENACHDNNIFDIYNDIWV